MNQIQKEAQAVKELGERIGYGNMMCLASALWRESLSNKGYPIIGAFVPALICDIKTEEEKDYIDEMEHYDKLIKLWKNYYHY